MNKIDINHIDKSKWATNRFDQIASSISERVEPTNTDLDIYVGLEHLDSDSIHIQRTGKKNDVEGTKLRVYPGDVIFGRRRAYQRKAAIATFDGFCSAHALVLRANPKVIDPKLFPFFLHSDEFMHRAINISVGSLSPTINWGTLKHEEFLLPPKEQQAKIAELLWATDDVIQRLHFLQECLIKLRMIAVELSSNGDTTKSQLSEAIIQKKNVSNSPHSREKYIGLEHVPSGAYRCMNFGTSESAEANCFEFDKGDLLYSKLRPYLDKVFIASFEGVCTTELIVMNTIDGYLPDYILSIFHSPSFIAYVNSKSYGTKMPRVSFEIIGNYLAYLPKTDVQIRIVEKINKIQQHIDMVSSQVDSSRSIQRRLINEVFK